MQKSVLEYLEETANVYAGKTAIVDVERELTFQEVRGYSINLAEHILERKLGKGQPVLIYLPKSVWSVVAMMGILYSGNFYTPTDVRFPMEKVKSIIDALEPKMIITNKECEIKLRESGMTGYEIIYIEDISYRHYGQDVSNTLLSSIISTDPVYIFFTSGSTGVPKGVVINNQNIIDYIDFATEAFCITDETVMGNQSPFYFDISTQDIYSCLSKGARLVIIPEKYFVFPVQALNYINEKEINFLYWVPSAFVNISILRILEKMELPRIKTIMYGGEVMPVKHLNYWLKNVPSIEMTANVYGPTEATVNCTYYIIDREFKDDEVLPLGKACPNTELFVFDDENHLITEQNQMGELFIRGTSLSMGYWKSEEKTAEMYVQNPLHNNYPELLYHTGDLVFYNERNELVFAGRKDYQIKHMGYRIELGEIENIALSIEGITGCCCIYEKEKKRIIMCYTAGRECSEESFIDVLEQKLPQYMRPSGYVRYKTFPINDNGKVDRIKIAYEIENREL